MVIIESFLYTCKTIARYYRSEFGTRGPYPHPKKPEPWSKVLQTFPQLEDGQDRSHISFAIDGEVLPYGAVPLKRYRAPISFWADVIGPPKSKKTRSLRKTSDMLHTFEVPHVFFGEPSRISFLGMNDRAALNEVRAYRHAAFLRSYETVMQSGGELKKQRNFYLTENGMFHSLVFAHMQAFLQKRPELSQRMTTIARPFVPFHSGLIILDVPWHVSMFGGTKMSYNSLIGYKEGLSRLKRSLPQLTDGNKEPLAIIDINNTQKSPASTADFILQSLGTILRRFDHD